MSEKNTAEYEVRLWCECGVAVAYAEVYIDGVGWKVDCYGPFYEQCDLSGTLDQAERDARRWVMSQDEYDTEGHSVQIIRNGLDVTSDPCESF